MDKEKNNMLNRIISQIAIQEGTSEQDVRNAMQEAIKAGFENPDPLVRARWEQISTERKAPTPEAVILWAISRIAQMRSDRDELDGQEQVR